MAHKRKIASLLTLLITLVGLTSCDKKPDIIGVWSGTPTRYTGVPTASYATSTIDMIFDNDSTNLSNKGGLVMLSATILATQPVEGLSEIESETIDASVTARASIKGWWAYDDDDELIIALDPESIDIDINPDGVVFTKNIFSGIQQPTVDSLTSVTVDMWKQSLASSIGNVFYKYNKISDIKIKNGILSCEIADKDLSFHKVH